MHYTDGQVQHMYTYVVFFPYCSVQYTVSSTVVVAPGIMLPVRRLLEEIYILYVRISSVSTQYCTVRTTMCIWYIKYVNDW